MASPGVVAHGVLRCRASTPRPPGLECSPDSEPPHELFNETNRDEVITDLQAWLNTHSVNPAIRNSQSAICNPQWVFWLL